MLKTHTSASISLLDRATLGYIINRVQAPHIPVYITTTEILENVFHHPTSNRLSDMGLRTAVGRVMGRIGYAKRLLRPADFEFLQHATGLNDAQRLAITHERWGYFPRVNKPKTSATPPNSEGKNTPCLNPQSNTPKPTLLLTHSHSICIGQ
jgi:hypothetical protein